MATTSNPLIAALRANSPAPARSAEGPRALNYDWMKNTVPTVAPPTPRPTTPRPTTPLPVTPAPTPAPTPTPTPAEPDYDLQWVDFGDGPVQIRVPRVPGGTPAPTPAPTPATTPATAPTPRPTATPGYRNPRTGGNLTDEQMIAMGMNPEQMVTPPPPVPVASDTDPVIDPTPVPTPTPAPTPAPTSPDEILYTDPFTGENIYGQNPYGNTPPAPPAPPVVQPVAPPEDYNPYTNWADFYAQNFG